VAKVNRTGHASLQFGPGETFLAPPTTVEWEPVPPWPMPTDLAALLWVDQVFPFAVTGRPPNPRAAIAIPAIAPA